MLLRLSLKLAKRLHVSDLKPAPPEPDPYAEWYSHTFSFDRVRYIIALNTSSLFTTVFYGKGVIGLDTFMPRFTTSLAEQCASIGADRIYRERIAPSIATVNVAKAPERKIIGCMNEQIFMATAVLAQDYPSLVDLASVLNKNLLSPIGYLRPREAFLGGVWDEGKRRVVFREEKELNE